MAGPLLIIYGTRGVTMTKDRGEFNCPSCGTQRGYRHRRVRRFFTLYFIPLIPLDLLGEYVECDACSDTFEMGVLHYNPQLEASFEAEFHHAIRRVMVLMMLADGEIDDDEVTTIQTIYGQLAGRQLTEADVHQEAAECQAAGANVEAYLAPHAGTLNPSGKEMVIKAAYFVAMADGLYPEEERELLMRCAHALGMTDKQVTDLVATLAV